MVPFFLRTREQFRSPGGTRIIAAPLLVPKEPISLGLELDRPFEPADVSAAFVKVKQPADKIGVVIRKPCNRRLAVPPTPHQVPIAHQSPLDKIRCPRRGQTVPRLIQRSEEHTSELQSRVDISYAVFCLK